MDAYTKELLALAVEAMHADDEMRITKPPNVWCVTIQGRATGKGTGYQHRTFADALAALLRDLGVEVPERPSAERVQRELMRFENLHPEDDWDIDDLRDLYAREPLTVLALLEGDPS